MLTAAEPHTLTNEHFKELISDEELDELGKAPLRILILYDAIIHNLSAEITDF